MRKPPSTVPSEHDECVWFAQYLEQLKDQGVIRNYTHVANETYTPSWNAKNRNKLEGLVAGFPDYVIVTQDDILFIEMKRIKGGVISESQKLWLRDLNAVNHNAVVCNGYNAAKQWLDARLSNVLTPSKPVRPRDRLDPL